MTIVDYIHTLSENPYFGAGFGLFGVGAGAAILRKGMQAGMIFFSSMSRQKLSMAFAMDHT